jgi:hypothetical protein
MNTDWLRVLVICGFGMVIGAGLALSTTDMSGPELATAAEPPDERCHTTLKNRARAQLHQLHDLQNVQLRDPWAAGAGASRAAPGGPGGGGAQRPPSAGKPRPAVKALRPISDRGRHSLSVRQDVIAARREAGLR